MKSLYRSWSILPRVASKRWSAAPVQGLARLTAYLYSTIIMTYGALKQHLKSRCATFFKETTFHGFFELRKSKRWYEKCAWILVMLGCTGMLCYNIAMQVDQYLDGELVTRSTRFRDEDPPYVFPSVLLTLDEPSWIDASKVATLGFTYEEIIVALGYLRPAVGSTPLDYESDVPVETAKKTLRSNIERLGINGIHEMLSNISWVKLDGLHDNGLVNRSTFNREGVFHILNTTGANKTDYTKTWKYRLLFDFAHYRENINKTLEFLKMGNLTHKLFKPYLFNPDTEQEFPLYSNHKYMISVDCSMYRRLHGCHHTDSPQYFEATCELDCRLQAARNAYSCVRATDNRDGEAFEASKSFRKGLINLCHLGVLANGSIQGADTPEVRSLSEREQRDNERAAENCRKDCVPKCERFSSIWSIVTYPCDPIERCSETAMVTVVFPDAESLVITVEMERYKWHDIVSNIGGLLGLWLGASIMSIFQAIHLCCCWEDEAKDGQKEASKAKGSRSNGIGCIRRKASI